MQSPVIRDAARLLEEAASAFRFKSRAARDEYDQLLGHWTDSRAQQFALQHIEPQHGLIQQGERLCQAHTQLTASALAAASSAENEISGYRSAEDDFENSAAQEQAAARDSRTLASNAASQCSSVEAEIASLNAAISSAKQDPGW